MLTFRQDPRRGAPTLAVGSTLGLPAPATTWSVRQWATYVAQQGQVNKCEGEALADLCWIATRGAGKRVSARGAWANALARQVANAKGAPLPDVGVSMQNVVNAAVESGVFAADEKEDDPVHQEDLVDFAEAANSVLIPPDAFIPIADGDLDSVDQVGAAGYGVAVAIPLYESYEALTDATVWMGPEPGEKFLGYHDQVCVARSAISGVDTLTLWGSWGESFAAGGFSNIARAWMAKSAFNWLGANGKIPVLT